MKSSRMPDFVDRFRELERRVRRIEVRKGNYVERTFILDPVEPRTMPSGRVQASTLVTVGAKLDSGGPLTVNLVVVQDGVPATVASYTLTGGAGWSSTILTGGGVRLAPDDEFYPVISGGTGGNLSASFRFAI